MDVGQAVRELPRRTARTTDRLVVASWPAVERVAKAMHDRGLRVEWASEWSAQHDRALDELALGDEATRWAQILGQPTGARKCHAVVRVDGELVGVVTLRRRPGFWEPVSAQCLPGTPIACRDEHLGRVLRGLGVEVRIGSLFTDPAPLDPTSAYSYERYGADLRGDYEAFWPGDLFRARKKAVGLEARADHAGDLAWIIDRWEEFWREHPNDEVAAAQDRRNLWPELQREGHVHTVVMHDAGTPAAGCVLVCFDGVAKFDCTGRDPSFDRRRAGIRALDASFAWAAGAGYEVLDVGGGGEYKSVWGPVYATSYGAHFVPKVIRVARGVRRRLEDFSETAPVEPDALRT
jgi:hypothetical protein